MSDTSQKGDLSSLSTGFRLRAREVLRLCAEDGCLLHPISLLRTCPTQARLFRQSRSLREIENKADYLRDLGHPKLADILISVGPQFGTLGRHVTMAGPGESWHNYGEALDVIIPSAEKRVTYGAACLMERLEWGGSWTSLPFRDPGHCQYRPGNPLKVFGHEAEDILQDVGTLIERNY